MTSALGLWQLIIVTVTASCTLTDFNSTGLDRECQFFSPLFETWVPDLSIFKPFDADSLLAWYDFALGSRRGVSASAVSVLVASHSVVNMVEDPHLPHNESTLPPTPTSAPTSVPTRFPTMMPTTGTPTSPNTGTPTGVNETMAPTNVPTAASSASPTAPTMQPTTVDEELEDRQDTLSFNASKLGHGEVEWVSPSSLLPALSSPLPTTTHHEALAALRLNGTGVELRTGNVSAWVAAVQNSGELTLEAWLWLSPEFPSSGSVSILSLGPSEIPLDPCDNGIQLFQEGYDLRLRVPSNETGVCAENFTVCDFFQAGAFSQPAYVQIGVAQEPGAQLEYPVESVWLYARRQGKEFVRTQQWPTSVLGVGVLKSLSPHDAVLSLSDPDPRFAWRGAFSQLEVRSQALFGQRLSVHGLGPQTEGSIPLIFNNRFPVGFMDHFQVFAKRMEGQNGTIHLTLKEDLGPDPWFTPDNSTSSDSDTVTAPSPVAVSPTMPPVECNGRDCSVSIPPTPAPSSSGTVAPSVEGPPVDPPVHQLELLLPNTHGSQTVNVPVWLPPVSQQQLEQLTVAYGQYPCQNVRTRPSVDEETTHIISCETVPGIGRGFSLHIAFAFSSSLGIDLCALGAAISYPGPIIHSQSLRICSAETAITDCLSVAGAGTVTAFTNDPDQIIVFEGAHFGNDFSNVVVVYGKDSIQHGCVLETDFCTDQIIVCRVVIGQGAGFRFQVSVGDDLHLQSATGADFINFPFAPVVVSIFAQGAGRSRAVACTHQRSSTNISSDRGRFNETGGPVGECFEVFDLPTTGLAFNASADNVSDVVLSIHGDRFLEITGSCFVAVAGIPCLDAQRISEREMTCRLPPGAGTRLPVVVTCGRDFSEGANLLSYARPSLYAVGADDCVNELCPPVGGVELTILGANMGQSGASVLIGGVPCVNTTHDSDTPHNKLTCILPPFSAGSDRSVVVVQASGDLSEDMISVSYAQCEAGTSGGTAVTAYRCVGCPAGRFSNQGDASCGFCQEGFFAANSSSERCDPCPQHSHAPLPGSSNCTQCAFPQLQFTEGSRDCQFCEPQSDFYTSFDAGTGEKICSACPAVGARCGAGRVQATAGYWMHTDAVTFKSEPQRCPAPDQCLDNGGCAAGRLEGHNPLCGKCQPQFYEWGGKCTYCDPNTQGERAALMFGLLIFLQVYVLVFHIISQPSARGLTRIFIYFAQTAWLLVGNDHAWLSFFSIFNFNVFTTTRGLCVGTFMPITKLWLGVAGPVIGLIQLWLCAFIAFCLWVGNGNPWREFRTVPFLRTTLALLMFSYNTITYTVFSFLQCVDAGGTRVVRSSPSIECSGPVYDSYLVLALLLMIFIVIGGPLALLFFLIRNRQGIWEDRPEVRARLGLLYEVYRKKRSHYFEFVAQSRRTIYLGIVTTTTTSSRVDRYTALSLVSIGFLLLHVVMMPFKNGHENALELLCLTSLTCLAVVLARVETLPFPDLEFVVTALLVFIPSLILVALSILSRVRKQTWDVLKLKLDDAFLAQLPEQVGKNVVEVEMMSGTVTTTAQQESELCEDQDKSSTSQNI